MDSISRVRCHLTAVAFHAKAAHRHRQRLPAPAFTLKHILTQDIRTLAWRLKAVGCALV